MDDKEALNVKALQEVIVRASKISDKEFDKLAAEIFKGPKSAAEIVKKQGMGRLAGFGTRLIGNRRHNLISIPLI